MNYINLYQSFIDHSSFSRNIVSKYYYQLISPYLESAEIFFMNYGYAGLGESIRTIKLDECDEPYRMPIQLYHHLASSINLEGKDVLEVSCGRGGGASFVNRYYQLRSLVGIDRTAQAIKYCRRKHQQPGLSFLKCDAEAILFGSECFDVVLNVEASHLYPCVDTFLSEVRRVLRPGGYLLLADKRTMAEIHLLRRQISTCGLEVLCEHDISGNVLRSIQLQQSDRLQMLKNQLPRHLVWLATHVIGADGSHLANAIAAGETVYLSFILRKV